MAILKRGSRAIVVDGTGYRWNVRRKPTYRQDMGWSRLFVGVEQSDCRGSVLIGGLPQFHSANSVGKPIIPVLPGQVRLLIRAALAAGWKPEKAGKPFLLQNSAEL